MTTGRTRIAVRESRLDLPQKGPPPVLRAERTLAGRLDQFERFFSCSETAFKRSVSLGPACAVNICDRARPAQKSDEGQTTKCAFWQLEADLPHSFPCRKSLSMTPLGKLLSAAATRR